MTGKTGDGIPLVLVHGALRSRLGLIPTALWFSRRGYVPHLFGYSSRRGCLADHGRSLEAMLRGCGLWRSDRRPLCFLTHSMGALVVRALFAKTGAPPRPVRLAMLSPPNRGATLAGVYAANPAARWLYGAALDELSPRRVAGLGGLPPGVTGLVLAGGRGHPGGYHPAICGDDDGVVAVADMPLAGTSWCFVGGVHSFLQWRPSVLAKAARFFGAAAAHAAPGRAPAGGGAGGRT